MRKAPIKKIPEKTGIIPRNFIVLSATAMPITGRKKYTYENAFNIFSGMSGNIHRRICTPQINEMKIKATVLEKVFTNPKICLREIPLRFPLFASSMARCDNVSFDLAIQTSIFWARIPHGMNTSMDSATNSRDRGPSSLPTNTEHPVTIIATAESLGGI